ncbi:Hypothetical predicted protein [Cloeon dipterum]|uniref:Uncharacterized protein n=1 Tax=Cloeon dipterum TaxID=197152 RepID=A0A8S1DAI5_9INSE|nr:Hypothetical predicted protein [Cloeon dipterum]
MKQPIQRQAVTSRVPAGHVTLKSFMLEALAALLSLNRRCQCQVSDLLFLQPLDSLSVLRPLEVTTWQCRPGPAFKVLSRGEMRRKPPFCA